MSPQALSALHLLEGHHVALRLRDGARLDGCELVSAGRRRSTVWVLHGGTDAFVPVSDIAEVWEA